GAGRGTVTPILHPVFRQHSRLRFRQRTRKRQPEPFLGDVEACGGFLLQCQLIFQQAPRYYQSDHSKITLIINSLRSKAIQWAQAFITANPISQLRYDHFINEFPHYNKWEEQFGYF
uniref:DUF4939 domain-containing protein n=1 Tax=Oryzias latipes TaxID=8090 RepID=A0A3P9LL98_ORYLA